MVAFGELAENGLIDRERVGRVGVDDVHAVLLVNGLAEDEQPLIVPLFEEVIEAAGADDVDPLAVHFGAL